MNKLKHFFLISFLILILVGCAEQKLLEQVGMSTLLGYDLSDDNQLLLSAVIREVNPEYQSNVQVITAKNKTSRGALSDINRKTSKKVMTGQMRVVLFGEELASEGIGHYIDTLSKNSETSGNLLIAIVEGETNSLLEYDFQNIEDVGSHIFKLLEHNIKNEQMISSTLHEVARDYYSIGRDIAIPILKREDETIEISGVALFNAGKMVGKLPAEDSFYVKLSRELYESALFETTIPRDSLPASQTTHSDQNVPIVLDTINTEKKVKLIDPGTPEYTVEIEVFGRLLEIEAEMNLDKQKNVKLLEEEIGKSISKDLEKVLVICQEVNSDVFGLGEYYRSSVRNSKLTNENWKKLYPQAKVNIKVNFKILRSGSFE